MKNAQKAMLLLALGVLVLAVLVTAIFLRGGSGGGDGSNTSFASMLPIWIAVFIPLIANRNQQKETTPNQKKYLALAVGLTVLLVLGTIVFAFFR